MNKNEIRELAEIMREMQLTAIEISEEGSTVRLERGLQQPAVQMPQPAVIPISEAPASDNTAAEQSADASNIHTIESPMVGVFYAAPAPDQNPYVSIGDSVKAGDTLCIIEAMKMMNEITADVSGVIVEVCVGDKQVVDYGHPLFRIKS